MENVASAIIGVIGVLISVGGWVYTAGKNRAIVDALEKRVAKIEEHDLGAMVAAVETVTETVRSLASTVSKDHDVLVRLVTLAEKRQS